MKSILIPIHSFVDIITNSSSEVFVEATAKTVEGIKKLVNSIILAAGGIATADDLFVFDVVYPCTTLGDWKEVYLTEKEIEEKKAGENADSWSFGNECDGETYPQSNIRVTVKVANENAKIAAAILENLTGLFSVESSYNG
jgi:hypothetical protein